MAILRNFRTQTDIVQDGNRNLRNNVGITATNPSSTSRTLLELMAGELTTMWDKLDFLLTNSFLSTATGSYLDQIGEFLQERRVDALRAIDLSTSNVKFSLDPAFASSITSLITQYYTQNEIQSLFDQGLTDSATLPTELRFPAPISVSSQDGSASFSTMNALTISNSQIFDYSPVVANGLGSSFNVSSNSLISHDLQNRYPILSKVVSAITVTNLYAIRNGADLESDENYRYRLSNKVVAAATGNETAIRKAVLSVPSVVDLGLVRRSHGNGTFTIFPRCSDPIISDGIVAAIQQAVSTDKSFGDLAFVTLPNYLGVTLRIELRFAPSADKESIYAKVRLAIINYINNLLEGGTIVINEIVQRVMSVDEKIIDMNISQFGYGNYDRVTGIVSGFTPLRLVNQTSEWNERFYTNSSFVSICQTSN